VHGVEQDSCPVNAGFDGRGYLVVGVLGLRVGRAVRAGGIDRWRRGSDHLRARQFRVHQFRIP